MSFRATTSKNEAEASSRSFWRITGYLARCFSMKKQLLMRIVRGGICKSRYLKMTVQGIRNTFLYLSRLRHFSLRLKCYSATARSSKDAEASPLSFLITSKPENILLQTYNNTDRIRTRRKIIIDRVSRDHTDATEESSRRMMMMMMMMMMIHRRRGGGGGPRDRGKCERSLG